MHRSCGVDSVMGITIWLPITSTVVGRKWSATSRRGAVALGLVVVVLGLQCTYSRLQTTRVCSLVFL